MIAPKEKDDEPYLGLVVQLDTTMIKVAIISPSHMVEVAVRCADGVLRPGDEVAAPIREIWAMIWDRFISACLPACIAS